MQSNLLPRFLPYRSLPIPRFPSLSLPRSSFLLLFGCLSLSLSCSTVRTRSSSVIDRNLSLTSLPPGAKILPGALRPRPVASPLPSSSSSSRRHSLLFARAPSLLVSASEIPSASTCMLDDNRTSGTAAGAVGPAARATRSLFTESINEVNAIFIYLVPTCRCSRGTGANRSRSLWHTSSAPNARFV